MFLRTIWLSFLFLPSLLWGQTNRHEDSVQTHVMRAFYEIISPLAADSMEGREPSTMGEQKAQHFLTHYCNTHNIDFQWVPFSYKTSEMQDSLRSANLIAYFDNHQAKTLLISAHYDHLGKNNSPKSREIFKKGKIHNGADDNASGVAMAILLFEHLRFEYPLVNYQLMLFSAHEQGLYGASAYVRRPNRSWDSIQCLMNFDMVGRLDTKDRILALYTEFLPSNWDSLLLSSAPYSLHLMHHRHETLISDCTPFRPYSIPTLSFTTGKHSDYHRSTDDTETLNFEGMVDIYLYLKQLISQL